MLSHYTDDVLAWLRAHQTGTDQPLRQLYHSLCDKLEPHLGMVTPISYYHQLTDLISSHHELAHHLVMALQVMYDERRKS